MSLRHLEGIVASHGYAIGKALVIKHRVEILYRTGVDMDIELGRLRTAKEKSLFELQVLKEQVEREQGEDQAAIIDAQILMLQDPELTDSLVSRIRSEQVNAEYAVEQIGIQYVKRLEALEDAYLRERAVDIKDITQRLIRNLLGITSQSLSQLLEETIVVADDLTPSQTAQMDKRHVKGIATNIGGGTSHTAIMARALRVPAVVGLQTITEQVRTGELVIVDGSLGKVIVQPTEAELADYRERIQQLQGERDLLAQWVDQPTLTADGHHIELAANISDPSEVESAIGNGAEGIGLYRTEFLFLGREQLPTEEEQFMAYKAVVEGMKGKPVLIRTLDIGGDKVLPYLKLPVEMNPFLGVRAIRLCLNQRELFKVQLRAILRASRYGDVRVMYPMIATVSEIRAANEILSEAKQELMEQGIEHRTDLQVGIMIEVPTAAIAADVLAPEVDFFSIGTNDLIQYTFACDRLNEQLSYLYQPYHPSILRLIQMVIDAAKKAGRWVGICGEMASDPLAVPILVGMGINELSMNASSILSIRRLLVKLKVDELRSLVDEVMQLTSQDEVKEHVRRAIIEQSRQSL